MPDVEYDPMRIKASPTKEFFIYMLTRDIPLSRAILDLVDNSVDGARRLRGNENFQGLWVRTELDGDHFKIADNCGGISVEIARNYAFRFGRPKDAPPTPGSVGQFGVGMKRTFFKLGRHLIVSSVTTSSRFDIDIDVGQWKAKDEPEKADDWHFEFSNIEENLANGAPEDIGTRIEIDQLYDPVAETFKLENFVARLKQEMTLAYSLSMDKELAISVNGIPLQYEPQLLFVSDDLKPAHIEKTYSWDGTDGQQRGPVSIKLFAGVAERKLHEGGWYVFCNGRLVLRADQTAATIWGQNGVRPYHPDFAFFRGYAYFDSDYATQLPWTTTKTGIDVDSPVYKRVKQEMIELSRPIISFLSNLAKETTAINSGAGTDRTLNQAIKNVQANRIGELQLNPMFVAPRPQPPPPGPKMQRIQYQKPLSDVEKAKQLLKVSTFTAVGEKTFDYFMEYEGED